MPATYKFLLLADANKIQAYLFESVNLKEIMGASLILKEFDEKVKKELVDSKELKNSVTVIYHQAGVVRATFSGSSQEEAEKNAEIAADIIRRTYHELTVSGTISFSQPTLIEPGEDGFKKANRQAELSLRENKQRGGNLSAMLMAWPYLRYCDACGLRPAMDTRQQTAPDNEITEEALCATCRAKRDRWNAAKKSTGMLFFDNLSIHMKEKHQQIFEPSSPEDFDQIGEKAQPSGYVGFIVADGNKMGKKLAKCGSAEEYEKLSKAITATLEQALSEAIYKIFRLDDKPENLQRYVRGYLPLQVLVQGGDDLVIVTTGDTALPLADEFCRRFAEIAHDEHKAEFTISAGVVLAKANLPFLISHGLADELLKEAKKKSPDAKGNEQGCVDFQVVTASNALNLKDIRQGLTFFDPSKSNKTIDPCLVFTARPYPVTGGFSLKALLEAIKKLKEADFSHAQLANLYEILNPDYAAELGPNLTQVCTNLEREYVRFKKRLGVETWKELEKLSAFMGTASKEQLYFTDTTKKPEERKILYTDALEIFEFVPVKGV